MDRPASRRGRQEEGRLLAPAAAVSAAFLGANALAYVLTVLAARLLAPSTYGELASLLGLLLVGSVPATGVQTAIALFLGGRRGTPEVVARLHAAALVVAAVVCLVGALLVLPLRGLLHLDGAAAVVWLVALLLPHTLVQCYQGLLQGQSRYAGLAVVTVAFAASKLAGGVAGLLLGGSTASTLAGMTAGCSLGALAGWLGAGRPGVAGRLRAPLRATARASGALLGLVVLVNLDLLLARHHLPARLAGEYAVAAIFAKVAFWLPQGVGVVLLPRLAEAERRHRVLPVAVGVVGGVGALLVLGTAALGRHALPLVGGSSYGGSIGTAAWMFALLGTLMAVAQLLLYSGIAAADHLATAAVWAAVVLEVVVVQVLAGTGRLSLVTTVLTALGAALLLVATGLVRLRRARTAGVPGAVLPAPGGVPGPTGA
ncbi:polysaccharide biosynthesis protein [Blastococcus sp. TF02A-30]|uniref:polysaccharide biosynthesis protein n=1 Tax=Blastococcus sp. TF02A-30 TaxID=2250580 RepID=UPI000DEBB560|nr:polysaccharide biosynthesis protein [Blastococcus sp. TF02A-30]RBY87894.1 polysaccharide biosynthesis protein [Blastococcus sp. TF02A-30]